MSTPKKRKTTWHGLLKDVVGDVPGDIDLEARLAEEDADVFVLCSKRGQRALLKEILVGQADLIERVLTSVEQATSCRRAEPSRPSRAVTPSHPSRAPSLMSGVVNRKRPSGAGPPKRRERDEATVEQQMVTTTVYAISKTPFRAVVFLPTLETRLTTEAVKAAFAEQFPDRAFPTLPQGHFEVVWSNQQGQVALFWHKKVKGCRKTGSTHHGHLPRPIVRHTERHNITCEPSLRVGFEYLFGYSHAYTITEEREIKLSQQFPPGLVKKRTEPQRTTSMVSTLKKHFTRANVTLEAFSRNSSHFCPFSGGGDIQVFQTSGSTAGHPTAAVVMTGQEDEDEPEPVNSPDLTPPKAHEGRCGSVENKITGPQTEREALLQLQADMVLTCATLLEDRLSSPSSTPELFDTLVCYGVLLGVTYLLKLLKLTIDFVKEDMVFEERFSLNVCLFSPIYIDLVLHYVFQSVDCK